MNSFKNNHRRGRFMSNGDRNFRKRNGNGHKVNGDFNNVTDFKRRHPGKNNQNAAKLVEKYNDMAREALTNGDKILSENYLQHSEHFLRILISQENSRVISDSQIQNSVSEEQISSKSDDDKIDDTTTK